MSEPSKRSAEEIKQQVLTILTIFENGYKDKYPNDPYFDGYRAAIKNFKELVSEIKLEN